MQRRRLFFILSLSSILIGLSGWAAEDPLRAEGQLRSIRRLSDEVYRISQEMVEHGADGHTEEVSARAQKMAETTETLIREVQSSQEPRLQIHKKKILSSLKTALKKANEAGRLADRNKTLPSLDAARSASFQAKRARQEIQTIR